jgi:uracil-DNA glycosylase family 4
MKIMQSFADCLGCKLIDADSCIMDTNSRADLTQVDVVFVAENPGKDEIKQEKPMVGRSGKTFRKFFDQYIKKDYKWLLTNAVMCLTLDEKGNTGTPDDETIERCKVNCFNIIKTCKPKLIVLLGTSPMKAFGIAENGVTKRRGQFFKWEGFDVLLTIHPSYVNRDRKEREPIFEEDIKTAAEFLSSDEVGSFDLTPKTAFTNDSLAVGNKGIYRYQIPKKFYTEDYRLVDIQFLSRAEKVLYIFRDKDNNKVYHTENDDYYCYQSPADVEARKIVSYDKLDIVKLPYKDKIKLNSDITYEGDLRITVKHAFDYYAQNKGEAKRISSNIMFCDIEIDVGINNQTFPQPSEALYPVDLITSIFQTPKKKICYILDNGSEEIKPIEDVEFKIFKNEKNLILAWIRDFKFYDPDFMSGWNFIGFDMEYMFNRMKRLKIPISTMSKFKEFYCDGERFLCKLPGCIVLDQMHLYKMFTFTKMENYKLDFIAYHELKRNKLELPAKFNKMYWEHLNTLIEYNVLDTVLLEELENKVNHINLLNELRTICTASFEAAASPQNQVDSIVVNFLREKGLSSKNAETHAKKKYPGAFVLTPDPGIYDTAVDFDFKSLYPSLIRTYNIGLNNFIMRTKEPILGYDLAYNRDLLPDKISMIMDPMFSNKEVVMNKEDIFKQIEDEELIHTVNGCFYTNHEKELSWYSLILENLLNSRTNYKNLMFKAKDEGNKELKELYFTKQLVYKVVANTLYGVIANKSFRFFNLACAAAITLSGQEALKASVIEGNNYMSHLKTGDALVREPIASKVEMYHDPESPTGAFPTREFDYIITGDTDSIFCCFEAFKGDKSDEVIHGHCGKIQDYLNGEIMKEIVEAHNVRFEECKLVLKNELIISRGLFLAKKRYAIHVTNNEGVKCDEVNYMGIEVKRSDFPSHSKVFLKELLDIVLKQENITVPKLFKFVHSKEKEFRKLILQGSKTVGRPVSFGKELKKYKTIPQGVRAMLAFNDISYTAHYPGSRGYMFRVRGIDYTKAPQEVIDNYEKNFIVKGRKLEVIAIPDEEDFLPDYYIPDVTGNLDFAYTARYKLMLDPLIKVQQAQRILTI